MSAAKHRLREPDALPSWVTSRRLLSVLVTAALVTGCLGFAISHRQNADSSVLDLSGDTAWLVSTGPGMVSEVSGSAGTPDTDVTVAGIRGHSVRVAQDAPTVLVADENTGVVHTVSASNFTTGTDISLGPGSVSYVNDGTGIYGINPVDGRISYAVEAPTSSVKHISLGTLVGNAEDTSDGTLWITEPVKGAVVPVRDGVAGRPVPVAPKGDDLTVATAGDAAIVVDGTTGRVIGLPAAAVGNGTGPRTPALSSRSLGLPSDGLKNLVPALPGDGPTAAFAVPALSLLVLVNTADLDVTTFSLTGARITGGSVSPPLEAAGNIYVSDGSGRLLVYAANGGLRRALQVSPGPADLNVFTRDGLIWANAPDGPDALVLDNGTARIIHKYSVNQKRPTQEPSAAMTVKPPQTRPTQAPPTQSAPTHPQATASSTSPGPEGTPAPQPSAGPGTATATATGSGTPTPLGTTLAPSTAPATAPAPAPTTLPSVLAPTTAPPPPQPTPSQSPAPTTSSPEPPQPVSSLCGTVITKDTTLTQNLNCPGEFALEIGVNNVTLNLKGHTVTCTDAQNGCIDINDFQMDGLDNRLTLITIENGTIVSSGPAVSFPGIDRGRLEKVSVTGVGAECAIFVDGSQDIRIINDTISNCQMEISRSKQSWVTGDTLNNDTVFIEQSDNIWVTGNALSGSLLEPVTGSRNVNTSPNQGNWTTTPPTG